MLFEKVIMYQNSINLLDHTYILPAKESQSWFFAPTHPQSPTPYTFTLSYLTFRLNLPTSTKAFLLFCVATNQPFDLYLYIFILRLNLIYCTFADIWSIKKILVPSILQYFIYRLNLSQYKEKILPGLPSIQI